MFFLCYNLSNILYTHDAWSQRLVWFDRQSLSHMRAVGTWVHIYLHKYPSLLLAETLQEREEILSCFGNFFFIN